MTRSVRLCLISILLSLSIAPFLWSTPNLPRAFAEEGKGEHARPASKKESKSKSKAKAKHKSKEEPAKPERKRAIGEGSKIDHAKLNAGQQQDLGLDVLLVLDASGSMRRTDPLRLRDQGAKLFIRFLGEQDRLVVVQFDRETKTVLEWTNATPAVLPTIDQAISSISVEGRFTNLFLPVASALELLQAQGRHDVGKYVVLLSDGKMDPHPAQGTPEALTEQLFNEVLPRYKKNGVKLFTLALSDEADHQLLARLAQATDGLYWQARDVNDIHRKFSELFLALKNPQTLPLDEGGFEIDQNIREATFFITRKAGEENVELLDPEGNEITNTNLPPNIRWYKASQFDVVTVNNPQAGRWRVWGIENPEGFASLLTDLQLQVHWGATSLNAGDSVLVIARLTEQGKPLELPELQSIGYYTLKIVNSDSKEVHSKVSLKDDGTGGDEKANDGLFSAIVPMEQEGEFDALVGVTSATFTRGQTERLSVSGSVLALSVEKKEAGGDYFLARVSDQLKEADRLKVEVVAKEMSSGETHVLPLSKRTGNPRELEGNAEELPPGEYEVFARIEEKRGKESKGYSTTIRYSKPVDESLPEADLMPLAETEEEESHLPQLITGGVLAFVALVNIFFFGIVIRRRFSRKPEALSASAAYQVPPEVETKLAELRSRVGESTTEGNSDSNPAPAPFQTSEEAATTDQIANPSGEAPSSDEAKGETQ